MSLFEAAALRALRLADPETAHRWAITALERGWTPRPGPVTSPRLHVTLAGLDLPNPVGLAAGFDKHATALDGLCTAGFGYVEIGGVTPRSQPGNPRPRVFRLNRHGGVINRYGLNSDGAEAVAMRLAAFRRIGAPPVPVGLNLGANKDSADRPADYAEVLRICGPHVDYATINVSSPNTEGLRELQGRAALWGVLTGVLQVRADLPRRIPVFVKIAPDMTDADLADVAEVAMESALDGIVATNTTTSRDGIEGRHASQQGGLSGRPLFARSTEVLATLYRLTDGKLPLIGVGGIEDADTAYAKIRAGATAVQLYSALTWNGLSLVGRIADGLDTRLAADGFANVADAVGVGTR
ncbi:MAG: quinone-dependent dihydroorotate dehydrogenase [Rhodobacteraceae bacterium]|nr:quinone-dependent dihydroorotate dehydrogenase [Paracoccaceae bacterium]